MKTSSHNKLYRDENLLRDIGFLVIAISFILVQGFDVPLASAALYAPAIAAASFGALLTFGYTLVTFLRILEKLEIRLGMRRGARY